MEKSDESYAFDAGHTSIYHMKLIIKPIITQVVIRQIMKNYMTHNDDATKDL